MNHVAINNNININDIINDDLYNNIINDNYIINDNLYNILNDDLYNNIIIYYINNSQDINEPEIVEYILDNDLPDVCPVCICDMKKVNCISCLPCEHNFHSQCINEWLQNYNNNCPLCRHQIK